MGLNYLSLDNFTRPKMIEEFIFDIDCEGCYTSKRFHEIGRKCYMEIMPKHLLEGTDDTLADDLINNDCFHSYETDKNGKEKRVPSNAAQLFAEGEFNRFYIRGLCKRAIDENLKLEIYRARVSQNPNPESEAIIGTIVNPKDLLIDLRANKGFETTIGLVRPNSGLSVKIIK